MITALNAILSAAMLALAVYGAMYRPADVALVACVAGVAVIGAVRL